MDEQLHEEIARKFLEYDFDRHGVKYGVLANEVLALVRKAGWKSGEEVWDLVMGAKKSGWDDCLRWHEAEGYVKLADDQSLPEGAFNYKQHERIFLEAGWRRVILEKII